MASEVQIHERLSLAKTIPLGLQHVFAMFGATVLVPFLTGLSPAVALLCSGIGTIVFLLFTGSKVPAYLGSSFAYIGALTYFIQDQKDLVSAMGGALTVGIIYIVVFAIIAAFGTAWIQKIVPPIVAGPVVAIIGLSLTPVAADMASQNWLLAIITLAVAVVFSIFAKGFLKIIPILMAVIIGYIVAFAMGVVHYQPIVDACRNFFVFPVSFGAEHLPSFNRTSILMFAPLALVTMIEDLGHMIVLGNITHTDPVAKPGFHKVLLGNGVATGIGAFFGGPPLTTYGENLGVLAVTRVYSSFNLWVAAVIAIILSLINPLQAAIMSIPSAVMGGVSILLFGMIGAAGLRNLVEAKIDFSKSKNLIIASVIFAVGIGVSSHGVAWATIAGIVLNLILTEAKED
jgi:uracil permease